MPASRTHRYTVGPADLDELIARRATLINAIRAAHPGLAETRLTRLEDGTFTDGDVPQPRRYRRQRRDRRRAITVRPPREDRG